MEKCSRFVVIRVLHTVRISNVQSTMCDNKKRKMVNLGSPHSDVASVCIVIVIFFVVVVFDFCYYS